MGGARRALVFIALLTVASAKAQNQASVITDIVIEGNKFVTKESILARMGTKVGQPYVQTQIDQDKSTLEKLGFFKAVDVRAVPLEGSNWKVMVQLSEFDMVKEIRIVGNTIVTTEAIRNALSIQVDQPFNLNDQKPSADAIAKLYTEKGYFALVDQLEPLEDSPNTVSVSIREMKVNSITVTGNSRTSERVMKRLIKTKPGDAYNDPKWIRDLQRIFNTQWFDKVNPSEKQTEEGFGVELAVDVKEARTGQVVIGATVDPRSSFAGQVKLMDTNFRGTGQSVGISLQQAISGGGPSVELDYSNPFIDRHDTSLSLSLYTRVIYRFLSGAFGGGSNDNRFIERRTGMAVGLSRPTSEFTTLSAGLRFEGIRTSDSGAGTTSTFVKQDGELLLGSFGIITNRRDLDADPSRGNYFSATIEPGLSHISSIGGAINDPDILGNNTFFRNTVEYRTYWSPQPARTAKEIDAPRRVVALRARYGIISGKVPFNEQYFMGGSDSLRGYQDDRFWGRQQLLLTAEYRHPIQKAFNGILFVDYGGAWGGYGTVNNFDQSGKFKMHVGYGIGFAFKTPLGNLRLDFGFSERGKSRTHFMIGTTF